MRRLTRFISFLLLLVFAVTVLAPHFAWEAAADDSHHGAAEFRSPLTDSDCDKDLPDTDHHDAHVCTGHMFNHMPIQVSHPASLSASGNTCTLSLFEADFFPSHVPDLPDRPPNGRSFA
jgi:hypothetical protein